MGERKQKGSRPLEQPQFQMNLPLTERGVGIDLDSRDYFTASSHVFGLNDVSLYLLKSIVEFVLVLAKAIS